MRLAGGDFARAAYDVASQISALTSAVVELLDRDREERRAFEELLRADRADREKEERRIDKHMEMLERDHAERMEMMARWDRFEKEYKTTVSLREVSEQKAKYIDILLKELEKKVERM
jgi:predicted phage gp36 major capsid-like protein